MFAGTREAGATNKLDNRLLEALYYVQSDTLRIVFSRFFIAAIRCIET